MTDKLIIDTNIFVKSFFVPDEEIDCFELISILDKIDARLLFSQNTIGELLYIIKRTANQMDLSDELKMESLHSITDTFMLGKSVNTRHIDKSIVPIIDDPDDQMFIDLAYATKTDYIITLDGNSGILDLTDVPFCPCTPKQYLDIVKSREV